MNTAQIVLEIDRMAAQPGIVGCALVDAGTGLVWHSSEHAVEHMWEAAIDYWRLYGRQKAHFADLGDLGAIAMYHLRGVLAIFPCCGDPELLLVAFGEHRSVDWISWQRTIRELGQLLRSH